MPNNDFVIHYHGFHPDDDVQTHIERCMDFILSQAPYGAGLEARIVNKNNHYKGTMAIRSSVGPFFCVSTNTDPKVLTDELVTKMVKNLARWKAKRFDISSQGESYEAKAI